MKQKIGIINYNIGNIGSVKRCLNYLNANFIIVNNEKELKKCEKIFLPGVGEAQHFFNCGTYEDTSPNYVCKLTLQGNEGEGFKFIQIKATDIVANITETSETCILDFM